MVSHFIAKGNHLMRYKQLTQEERYYIYALLKGKYKQQDIANALERSSSITNNTMIA